MDRKWLLGLGGAGLVVLILAIVVVFGGDGGGGPAGAARAFFAAIPSGGSQAAYGKAAPAFRSATTPDAWAATVSQYSLAQYASSSWNDAGKGGGDVETLDGVLTLKGGGVQPATVRLVKGQGGWSVYSVSLATGGVNGQAQTQAAQIQGAQSQTVPPVAGVAGAGASGAPPTAPSGAAPDQSAPDGDTTAPAPGYAAGYPQTPSPSSAPVTLIPTRISHDCGPRLLQMPGVETIDVHCVDPMAAVPGTRGQCQAIVNGGRPVNVSVVVRSYDPARDDAELDCRLY